MSRNRPFKGFRLLTLGWLLAIGSVFGQAEQQAQTTDHQAHNVLAESQDRLASAGTMAFRVLVTNELPTSSGPPLTHRITSDVVMARPEKLRVITSGDGPFTDFYYDGRTITEFSPTANFATATTAPSTIDGALKAAYSSSGIYFPFAAIMSAEPYTQWLDCIEDAVYVGQARLADGTMTHRIAYTTNGMFVQLWIGVQDRLPRRMLAVFCDDPLQLRHQLDFSNWQIDQPVSAEAFNVNNAILRATEQIPTMLPAVPTVGNAR